MLSDDRFPPTSQAKAACRLSVYPVVSNLAYDRKRALDRLIAAQAISRDARLITRNGKDFRRIESLQLEEW